MQYKGCELSHMEDCKAINDMDFDQGWSMVFEQRDANGKLLRTIKASVEPDAILRQRQWLKKLEDRDCQ